MSQNTGDAGFREVFDLKLELTSLESRKPWPQKLASKTLLKSADLRIVLIAMQSGAKMQEHHNDGRISVHVLCGSLRLEVAGKTLEMTSGHLLALDRTIKHSVEALEDSAFLLSIAWPSDKELAAQPHRGYGT
ncbi:MAG: hypothetical protein JWO13_2618 [Acidobacteriales bacterium]|nr:hypothetical protein [Terriglobales bacterium]